MVCFLLLWKPQQNSLVQAGPLPFLASSTCHHHKQYVHFAGTQALQGVGPLRFSGTLFLSPDKNLALNNESALSVTIRSEQCCRRVVIIQQGLCHCFMSVTFSPFSWQGETKMLPHIRFKNLLEHPQFYKICHVILSCHLLPRHSLSTTRFARAKDDAYANGNYSSHFSRASPWLSSITEYLAVMLLWLWCSCNLSAPQV